MNRQRMLTVLQMAMLAMLAMVAAGCGYKTPPVPPESVVPAAIGDLRSTLNDKGVRLTWSYPLKTIRGKDVAEISGFELFWAEIPLEEYCGGCPIPFARPLEIAGGPTLDGQQRRVATFESDQLRSGHKYFYKVRSRASWLAASADSNIVSFVWYQPAMAPAGVQAVAGDREASLSWQPVTSLVDGRPVVGAISYQVFRSLGGKEYAAVGSPQTTTSFVDRQLQNGSKYFYTVQSMMAYRDEQVTGGMSPEVAVVPVDLTPPLPPTGVTAVATDAGVKIFWDKSDETDLGGYQVYRRAADSDNYQLLGSVGPEYNLFVDQQKSGGDRFYWAVTAVDQATPANESVVSREATIRN